MYEDILEAEFDIFIAYHGTNDKNGSLKKAYAIYQELSKRAKCFFNPVSNPDGSFSDTPTVAKHSTLFLLVANDTIALNDKNEIVSPGLYREIDAFYKSQFHKIGNRGMARVYTYGNLKSEKANDFHLLFSGTEHFSESENQNALQKLNVWVDTALAKKGDLKKAPQTPPIGNIPSFPHQYEGVWSLNGEFTKFQGNGKARHTSVGRLILIRKDDVYKAIYCYSVSREFQEEASVTAICEGVAVIEQMTNGEERLTVSFDILSLTNKTKKNTANKHFRMELVPQFGNNGTLLTMSSEFRTKITEGRLVFTKGG